MQEEVIQNEIQTPEPTAPPQTCHRCHGLVVMDYTTDLGDSSECLWLPIWRCVSCGAMTEYKIMLHQFVQKSHPRLIQRMRRRARRHVGPMQLRT